MALNFACVLYSIPFQWGCLHCILTAAFSPKRPHFPPKNLIFLFSYVCPGLFSNGLIQISSNHSCNTLTRPSSISATQSPVSNSLCLFEAYSCFSLLRHRSFCVTIVGLFRLTLLSLGLSYRQASFPPKNLIFVFSYVCPGLFSNGLIQISSNHNCNTLTRPSSISATQSPVSNSLCLFQAYSCFSLLRHRSFCVTIVGLYSAFTRSQLSSMNSLENLVFCVKLV